MNAPTFQFYVPDFLASTADMSPEEVGIHIRLLCHQWMKGGIPNDIQRLMAMSGACQASSLEYVKSRYQLCEDGMLRHARMEEVRKEREEYIERQRINGGKRWKDRGKPDAVAMPSLCQASAKPDAVAMPVDMPNACSPTPSPSPSPSPSPTPDSNSQPNTMSGTPTKSDTCGAAAPPCSTELALPLTEAKPIQASPVKAMAAAVRASAPEPAPLSSPAPTVKTARIERREAAKAILEFLNTEAGRSFEPVDAHLRHITDRLADCHDDVAGVRVMISRQCAIWKSDSVMAPYLRPATLFGRAKFRGYYDDRNLPLPAPGARNGCAGARPHRNDFIGTPESRAAWVAQCAAADEHFVEGFGPGTGRVAPKSPGNGGSL